MKVTAPEISHDRGLWTIPNLISVLRLAGVPVFLWLLLGEDDVLAAGILFAVLGATDWIDGYIARRFDQGSEIGKILDPVSDRIMLIAGALGLIISGDVPVWIGILVLAREAALSVVTLVLAAAGARRIDVQWVGKAGTLALMFAFPLFVLSLVCGAAPPSRFSLALCSARWYVQETWPRQEGWARSPVRRNGAGRPRSEASRGEGADHATRRSEWDRGRARALSPEWRRSSPGGR